LYQLLSKVTSHPAVFTKCSMCPPCCWTTQS